VCNALAVYLNVAHALPPEALPLEVQFIITGDGMCAHPEGIAGSFECVNCVVSDYKSRLVMVE